MKRVVFFAVNSKQGAFFERIARYLGEGARVVYSRWLWLPSLRAFEKISSIDLQAPVALRVRDFVARYGCQRCGKFLQLWYWMVAYWAYLRYFDALREDDDVLVVWNGILFRQAIMLEIARVRGIKALYVETGLLPGRITVDPAGVNFKNSVPRERAFFERYKNSAPLPESLIPRQPKNAKKFASGHKEPLPKRYIFVPFQVDYDTQILVYSPWIRDMRHLFSVVEKVADATEGICFVFKEHPSSIKSYPDLHRRAESHPGLMFANASATQTLIENAEAVITVNSTVGIESLLFQKRVIVLGKAFYAIEGVCKQAQNTEQLQAIIKELNHWQPNERLIENFLRYLYYEYQVEGNFQDENPAQLQKIATMIANL